MAHKPAPALRFSKSGNIARCKVLIF